MEAVELFLTCVLIGSSLIVHELGHWVVLAHQRIPVNQFALGIGPELFSVGRLSLRLFPVGASVAPHPELYAQAPAGVRLAAALGGPWLSVLYACFLGYAAAFLPGHQGHALVLLSQLNWGIAALNLLPIYPLDGFHALMALVEQRGLTVSASKLNVLRRAGQGVVFAASGLITSLLLLGVLGHGAG